MSSIDEIISALRSSAKKTTESSDADACSSEPSSTDELSSPTENLRSFNTQDVQSQAVRHNLNFALLERMRKKSGCCVTVADVFETKSFKIAFFMALIKSVKRYSDDVVVAELVDETGTIECSMQAHLETKFALKAGEVLALAECSVWKVGSVHLNAIEENVVDR